MKTSFFLLALTACTPSFAQTPIDIFVLSADNCDYALTDTYSGQGGSGNMTFLSTDSMGFQNVHHYQIPGNTYPISLTVCLHVGATQPPFPNQTPTCITQTVNGPTSLTFNLDCSALELENLESMEKTLVKIVDLQGRETEFKANTPLIYLYSDGSRERVMKMEE